MEGEEIRLTNRNASLSSALEKAHEAQHKAEEALEQCVIETTSAVTKQAQNFEEKEAKLLQELAEWKSKHAEALAENASLRSQIPPPTRSLWRRIVIHPRGAFGRKDA